MLHKLISVSLVIAFANLLMVTAFANTSTRDVPSVKVKEKIQKLGTGESAKVKVSLNDKTELSGYISRADEDTFTIVSTKTGNSTDVEYSQVKKVKGNNLSTGAKIAIGVGIGLAALVIAVIANRKVCSNALCQ